jgi:hypothetical protein
MPRSQSILLLAILQRGDPISRDLGPPPSSYPRYPTCQKSKKCVINPIQSNLQISAHFEIDGISSGVSVEGRAYIVLVSFSSISPGTLILGPSPGAPAARRATVTSRSPDTQRQQVGPSCLGRPAATARPTEVTSVPRPGAAACGRPGGSTRTRTRKLSGRGCSRS